MRYLVTGGNGQLAYACADVLTDVINMSKEMLDITNRASVNECTLSADTCVINTAAIARPDAAEKDPELAYRVNTIGPLYLAQHVRAHDALLVHVSTDYVFDGVKGDYGESDHKNPKNVYGLTKSASEDAVCAYARKQYIIRTSALFGPKGKGERGNNFVTRLIDNLRLGIVVTMVDDQYTSPSYTIDVAKAIQALVEHGAPYGTYHVVNAEGGVTWYTFAQAIGEIIGTDEKLLVKGYTQDSGSGPYRPRKSVLRTDALRREHIILPSWRDSLRDYIATYCA
jgi:dTDP-4-dehydrorhamnose reductase